MKIFFWEYVNCAHMSILPLRGNHILSSLRITTELAFGQLVRRFGILWCYNSSHLENFSLMLVCAKLHNLCVDQWVLEVKKGDPTVPYGIEIPQNEQVPGGDVLPSDELVMEIFGNKFQLLGDRAAQNDIRVTLMENIYAAGIRITSDDDVLGLPI